MALARHVIRLPRNIRSKTPLLKQWSQRVRSRHLFALDTIGLSLAVIIALAVWKNELPAAAMVGAYLWVAGIVVCMHVAANILLGLYTNSWRYASIGDMGRILACTFAGTVSAALLVTLVMSLNAPVASSMPTVSFWLLETTLALGVLATSRFMIRAFSDLSDEIDGHAGAQRTLLYGAGWAGVMTARSAERNPASGVVPVGFLDDNTDLKGRRVGGLLVFGDIAAMARAKRLTGATTLLITMPRATGANVRLVVEAAMKHDLDVRTVPAVTDLIDGTIDASRTRRVRVEDLLRRPLVTEHSPALQELLHGQTVMVTGAAGSIGSELVRQVLALEPSRIVMVDQAESAMYMVARDLETSSQVIGGATTITSHLVDITDRAAVKRLMCETEPVVVFHAAAYKHVPMLEEHATQAARVNIGGTQSVVDGAIACGVERFVLVSTDKAVRPSSVMGASKRIAEMIVADAASRTGSAYVSVRFGNVLGSNGSVIPVFQSQLESGQPLTVTDAEMTRYFMTIPEASWLILDAAALSDSGCLYVLDMGEPVRVMDVAYDLIRLNGRDPDTVPIKYTGLRPGEKLHEELFYDDEHVSPTAVSKVLRSTTAPAVPATIDSDVDRFLALARNGRQDALPAELMEYVQSNVDVDVTPAMQDSEARTGLEAPTPANGYRPVVPVLVHSNGDATPSNGNGVGSRAGNGNGVGAHAGNGNGVGAHAGNGNGNHAGNGNGSRNGKPDKKVEVKSPTVIRVVRDEEGSAVEAGVSDPAPPANSAR